MSSEESLKQTLLIIDWVDSNTVDPGFKTLYFDFRGCYKDQLFISYTKLLEYRLPWKLQRTNYEPITRVVQI